MNLSLASFMSKLETLYMLYLYVCSIKGKKEKKKERAIFICVK